MAEQRENLTLHQPGSGENRFVKRVFQSAYRENLLEFNATLLQPQRLAAQVDELAGVLRAPLREKSPEWLAATERAAAGQEVMISMGPEIIRPGR